MKIKEIFNLIENVNGTNSKLKIIKQNLDNDLFIKCLKIIMNPDIKTGISRNFLLKNNSNKISLSLEDDEIIKLVIDKIESFDNKKNSKLEIISYYNSISDNLLKKVIYYLITKDCPIGIGDTLLRKTIPNFREKFEIMLGSRIEIDDINFDRDFILSQKLDGINLTVIKENDKILFRTRNGKIVNNLSFLEESYKRMPNGVYFGEALYSGNNYKDRKELYKLTTGELNSKRENKLIKHVLFDYVSLDEWKNNKFNTNYQKTISILEETINKYQPKDIDIVNIVFRGSDKQRALECLSEAKNKGWEGLMLRYSSSIYEKKRSKELIKLKPFISVDLKIVDYKIHKNENEGLGALIVEYKNGLVSVGSGYTKEERLEFWNKRKSLIGKIVEVQAMEETEDSSGKKSLRFPVFLRLRPDKDLPSYN